MTAPKERSKPLLSATGGPIARAGTKKPEDSDVNNEEYGVTSAGSYWVRNVIKITLR